MVINMRLLHFCSLISGVLLAMYLMMDIQVFAIVWSEECAVVTILVPVPVFLCGS